MGLKEELHHMLIEATEKQIELLQKEEWKNEILLKGPPILWFGDLHSDKSKIVTIGANPSRQEYLNMSANKAQQVIQQYNSQNGLVYLGSQRKRFRSLSNQESLVTIINNDRVREEMLKGYKDYFENNPYKSWFGDKKGGRVEALLNGYGASYYKNTNYEETCVHLDFFPFATVNNFGKITSEAERDLFSNGWAKDFLTGLINLTSPKLILVFGKLNSDKFKEVYSQELKLIGNGRFLAPREPGKDNPRDANYKVYRFNQDIMAVIIEKIYIPSSPGYSREVLLNLGSQIRQEIECISGEGR